MLRNCIWHACPLAVLRSETDAASFCLVVQSVQRICLGYLSWIRDDPIPRQTHNKKEIASRITLDYTEAVRHLRFCKANNVIGGDGG